MADTLMLNVPGGFNLQDMGMKLQQMWQAKGYMVNVMNMNNTLRIQFDKGCGGINMLLGLGRGITATCMLQGSNGLVVNYSDGDWTGKIVGLCVGWFLCFVPFITAIVGCVQQSSLPKEINNDIMAIVGSNPYGWNG